MDEADLMAENARLEAKKESVERILNQTMEMWNIEKSINATLTANYYELIMSVCKKIPGESRHQTALRYIREAENMSSITQAENGL